MPMRASAVGHLTRAHARTGDPVVLAGYMGKSEVLDDAVASFAMAYAAQTKHDHGRLKAAIVKRHALRPNNFIRSGARYAVRDLPFDLVAGIALAAIAVYLRRWQRRILPDSLPCRVLCFCGRIDRLCFIRGQPLLGDLRGFGYPANLCRRPCAPSRDRHSCLFWSCCKLRADGWRYPFLLWIIPAWLACGSRIGTGHNRVFGRYSRSYHHFPTSLSFGHRCARGDLLQQGAEILSHLGETRVLALGLGLFVFGATVCAEWITPRIPGHASSFWRQAALSKLTSPRRRFSFLSSRIARSGKSLWQSPASNPCAPRTALNALGSPMLCRRRICFHSVDEAIRALVKKSNEFSEKS
jgi:hypothetical protein